MFTISFAPKAKKQISKLKKTERSAIEIFLKEKVAQAKDKKGLYDIGGTELVGNLKGLWRFKNKEFRKYRIIGYLENKELIITVLAVESRSGVYKNKEDIAKKARKGSLDNKGKV